MPELPEVETTCRGIAPHVEGQIIRQVIIRQAQLRWRVPESLDQILSGLSVQSVSRRAKYLLFATSAGTLLVHLGMSGSLRIITTGQEAGKHDHIDFIFNDFCAFVFVTLYVLLKLIFHAFTVFVVVNGVQLFVHVFIDGA